MKNIIDCEVWCYAKAPEDIDRDRNLGIAPSEDDPEDCWMRIAVDFNSVHAIKEAPETEFLGKGKATLNFGSERFTINMPYEEAVKIWKKS